MTAVNISKEMLDPSLLIPHEDVSKYRLFEIISRIKDTSFMYPIIVDKSTYLILDGHHRYYASLFLKIRKIPVLLVDYMDSRIKIEKWFREVKSPELAKKISLQLPNDGDVCINIYGANFCSTSIYSLFWKLHWLENKLMYLGIKVIKNTKNGIEPPSISKEYVISVANNGLRFPPKTTRHNYEFIIHYERVRLNEFI
ncbi:ParB N-terminal domain-containing protein [Acidianus brierleyi]|nr:ParB N-terminal domain-containing protein [Acidianus brierleyi]AWR94652.2 hypothetical protein DFR85_08645 [Acidianus brierleyi]